MKKIFLSLLILLVSVCWSQAQTKFDKTYDLKKYKELDLIFEYPELVQIKVWDKDEVRIEGSVDIQGGEYDDNFEIRTRERGDLFVIESKIKDLDKFQSKVVWADSDDEDEDRTIISTDNGTTIYSGSGKSQHYRNGVFIDVKLVVTLPRDMEVMLDVRYGLAEVLEGPKSLEIDARYGGADVTIDESSSLQLSAKTQWGQIYSNLNVNMDIGGNDMVGQWMKARASLKQGKNRLAVESQYGNVYLRKN